MEIKKQYDIGAIANEIKDRIIISSNGEVCIDVLLAQNIVDVLEEIGRMESNKALENLKNGCDEKPVCYGKYSSGSTETIGCEKCSYGRECFIKSCRKKCFGAYKSLHPSVCANCKYICECKEETRGKGNA